jgi:DnaJ family protein C protein 12
MDAILNYRSEAAEDYYSLLGCDELSSVSLQTLSLSHP